VGGSGAGWRATRGSPLIVMLHILGGEATQAAAAAFGISLPATVSCILRRADLNRIRDHITRSCPVRPISGKRVVAGKIRSDRSSWK